MENNNQVLQQFLDFFQTTNKQNFFIRVGQIFTLIIQIFLYNQQEALVTIWKETRLESVEQKIQEQREIDYPTIVKEQVQIQYSVVKPDIVLIYEYIPIGRNNFAKLVDYEGHLPENINPEHLKNIPINKSQKEYTEHLTGRNFDGPPDQRALLLNNTEEQYAKRIYSCPIYNLENVYYSEIIFIWYKENHRIVDEEVLESQCLQASRVLGRAK